MHASVVFVMRFSAAQPSIVVRFCAQRWQQRRVRYGPMRRAPAPEYSGAGAHLVVPADPPKLRIRSG